MSLKLLCLMKFHGDMQVDIKNNNEQTGGTLTQVQIVLQLPG